MRRMRILAIAMFVATSAVAELPTPTPEVVSEGSSAVFRQTLVNWRGEVVWPDTYECVNWVLHPQQKAVRLYPIPTWTRTATPAAFTPTPSPTPTGTYRTVTPRMVADDLPPLAQKVQHERIIKGGRERHSIECIWTKDGLVTTSSHVYEVQDSQLLSVIDGTPVPIPAP